MKNSFTGIVSAVVVTLILAAVSARAGGGTTNATASAAATTSTNKIQLKVIKVDSEETAGEDGHGTNAVDGKPGTIWHTEWQDSNPPTPHEIIIEMIPPSSIK